MTIAIIPLVIIQHNGQAESTPTGRIASAGAGTVQVGQLQPASDCRKVGNHPFPSAEDDFKGMYRFMINLYDHFKREKNQRPYHFIIS